MGIGAIFGAILTMYTAVATRAREIATLRALGFNTGSVLVSVLAESMVLGLIGGAIGGAAAFLAFNGYQNLDDELPDVQPGGIRVSRHAGAARDGFVLRVADGPGRRAVSSDPRGAPADTGRASRTLNLLQVQRTCRDRRRKGRKSRYSYAVPLVSALDRLNRSNRRPRSSDPVRC